MTLKRDIEYGGMACPVSSVDYNEFLQRKRQIANSHGFEPLWMPDFLFDFQRHIVEWAIRKGRAAIFADCGLGKTPMQLVWAENVLRKANKTVLILTPLAVARHTEREAEKFGIDVTHCQDGKHAGGIVVTNYERLHYFDPADFIAVVCDESSILKNASGKTRKQVSEFMRQIQYRLLCTATAAPNDYHELGTSSDALGYLGYRDMLTMFFKEQTKKDFLGWGRKAYRFRGHAEQGFWRWVSSWGIAIRKPSDLGYSDDGWNLPGLDESEVVIKTSKTRDGMLFSLPARDLREQREERRMTIEERTEAVVSIVTRHAIKCPEAPSSVVWCHLNDEANQLERQCKDSVQVSGNMTLEQKEERLAAFQDGQIQVLVTKPKIGCFGLNWQHCCNVVSYPSHSYEQYYQAVRRCFRFGQERVVKVTVVTTEGEIGVLKNLQRKSEQASRMFDSLSEHMNDSVSIDRQDAFEFQEEVPLWL